MNVLAGRVDLSLRGDVGGFGVGSGLAWNAQGLRGYGFIMLGAGATAWGCYRAPGEDYEIPGTGVEIRTCSCTGRSSD